MKMTYPTTLGYQRTLLMTYCIKIKIDSDTKARKAQLRYLVYIGEKTCKHRIISRMEKNWVM